MKPALWGLVGGALIAVIASVLADHRAGKAEALRDSALAVSALRVTEDSQHALQANRAQFAADSALSVANYYRDAVKRLTSQLHHPPVPIPDTTVRDSLRFWRDSATVAQETAENALQALQAKEGEVGALRVALDSQKVATGLLRQAYQGERERGDRLEAALRKMPTGCQKFLGLFPMPRVGPQFGVIGRRVDFGVTIPLGC